MNGSIFFGFLSVFFLEVNYQKYCWQIRTLNATQIVRGDGEMRNIVEYEYAIDILSGVCMIKANKQMQQEKRRSQRATILYIGLS